MARKNEAKALLAALAALDKSADGAVVARRMLIEQLATMPEADQAFAAAVASGRWTDDATHDVAEAFTSGLEAYEERWLNSYDLEAHTFAGFEYEDLHRLYGQLGRALVRELGTRDPGSTAAERREFDDCENGDLNAMARAEQALAREDAQVEYWAERALTAKPRKPDTRYWDVATWADAQQAQELVAMQRGVTRTWVKRTGDGYRVLWNGPAFLAGDEVTHAERGGVGTVDDQKDGYYAVTWLDGRRGAYRAHELARP
jgi:hypothetical protein